MTKKDFELIASILKIERQNIFVNIESQEEISKAMAHTLAEKYPRFDKEKFLKACGVEEQYCCHDYNYRNGGKCSNCGN